MSSRTLQLLELSGDGRPRSGLLYETPGSVAYTFVSALMGGPLIPSSYLGSSDDLLQQSDLELHFQHLGILTLHCFRRLARARRSFKTGRGITISLTLNTYDQLLPGYRRRLW